MPGSGSIMRGGINYSNPGFMNSGFTVAFYADRNTGLDSKNVNDAINELAYIVRNAVEQFTTHTYELGTDKKATLKEALLQASRAVGGQHMFQLQDGDAIKYVGNTLTCGTKCSFTLHNIQNPNLIYYGYFDNLDSTSFKMYPVTGGSECFANSNFTL